MCRRSLVAMILAAGAAGLMPDADSARQTGPFGDWRASCRMFQVAVPLNMGMRPLRPAMESGVVYRKIKVGSKKIRLTLTYYYKNFSSVFCTPSDLDETDPCNQKFRIEILRSDASPWSAASSVLPEKCAFSAMMP